ncbi:hypothetical protein BC830DRAFT_1127141 [Chytriomyces sp. MP71]|nr:hypothetical protein BC830DRAFT_1127141 [Chytriomyces sp. MP71]
MDTPDQLPTGIANPHPKVILTLLSCPAFRIWSDLIRMRQIQFARYPPYNVQQEKHTRKLLTNHDDKEPEPKTELSVLLSVGGHDPLLNDTELVRRQCSPELVQVCIELFVGHLVLGRIDGSVTAFGCIADVDRGPLRGVPFCSRIAACSRDQPP